MMISSASDDSTAVLVVLHGEHSSPGRIGRLLHQNGVRLDIRRPCFGDPLPRTLEQHAGAIIFGGPMSANDADGFIKTEIDWISVPLKEGKPFLGICLGAQMLARTLGRRVCRHPQGRVEIGYYPIRPTEHGDAVCAVPFPDHVYHWHREGFEQPHGAHLLAAGGDFEAQAIRYGASAYGFQFHPEVTYAMICRWTGRKPERMDEPGAQDRSAHLDGWFLHDGKIAAWIEEFLLTWMANSEALAPAAQQAA
jgi:GMP synthase (glutamine-hydrolysing)